MSSPTKNECGKMRKVDNPYEVWTMPGWEWRVLKKYQSPAQEAKNPYARWHVAVKSPHTFGEREYGDSYVTEITGMARRLS